MSSEQPDSMYVTDNWAGVFWSDDGGATWWSSSSGITSRAGRSGDGFAVFSLTVDPHDPSRVWSGATGTSSAFRSDDGGDTWTLRSAGILERFATVRGFTVEPGDPDVVYLAAEIPSYEWNGELLLGPQGLDVVRGVVYRTEDAGGSWTRLWSGDNLTRHVCIDPDDVDRIFVSTGIFDRTAANADLAGLDPGGLGVLRSRDRGATWEALGVDRGFAADELYVGSLAMHPGDGDVLLAATAATHWSAELARPLGGVYRTGDGGESWTEVLDQPDTTAVEFCAGHPSTAYAAGLGAVYQSEDGGLTWEQRSGELWGPPGHVAGFPIDLECDPRDPDRVFVNSYMGGNFLSLDGGVTWVGASSGYSGAQIGDLAFVEQGDGAGALVSGRSGVFALPEGAQTWVGLGYGGARGLEAAGVAVDPEDPDHLFACVPTRSQDPWESRDGGASWTALATGAVGPELAPELAVVDVVVSPHDPDRLLGLVADYECWRGTRDADCDESPGGGILLSVDGGVSWERTSLDAGHPLSVAFAPRPAGPVWAWLYGRGLHRSGDAGATWAIVETAADLGDRVALAVDPANGQRLYAGGIDRGILISGNGGRTWRRSSEGMEPEASVLHVLPDPAHAGLVYAAAVNLGVFYSTDRGSSWQSLNEGLPTRAATRLGLSSDGSVLFVGTDGGGVARLDAR